jgi:hypothetical protein
MTGRTAAAGGLLTAAALLSALAAPAVAQNEPVRIFNRAPLTATALHVMRSGQTAWSDNLLRRDPLRPGEFLSVRLGEGAGCRFDLRLVLQDGREILRRDADVCATRSVDLVPDPPPAAPPPAPQPSDAEPVQDDTQPPARP